MAIITILSNPELFRQTSPDPSPWVAAAELHPGIVPIKSGQAGCTVDVETAAQAAALAEAMSDLCLSVYRTFLPAILPSEDNAYWGRADYAAQFVSMMLHRFASTPDPDQNVKSARELAQSIRNPGVEIPFRDDAGQRLWKAMARIASGLAYGDWQRSSVNCFSDYVRRCLANEFES